MTMREVFQKVISFLGNRKVFILILGVLLLGISIFVVLFIFNQPQKQTAAKPHFTFTYADGESPWLNHLDTKQLMLFSEALRRYPHLKELQCTGTPEDNNKNPFPDLATTDTVCLQGTGDKMVIPMVDKQGTTIIISSPIKGGLFERKTAMEQSFPLHYYGNNSQKIATKYVLVPFDNTLVPTYYPAETAMYLGVWKQAFQSVNTWSTDEQAFGDHVAILATTILQSQDAVPTVYFSVAYYYHDSWARVQRTDTFAFSRRDIADGVTADELVRDMQLPNNQAKFKVPVSIGIIRPLKSVTSTAELQKKLQEAVPSMTTDINKDLFIDTDGQIKLKVHGQDPAKQTCTQAVINIDTATLSPVVSFPCSRR